MLSKNTLGIKSMRPIIILRILIILVNKLLYIRMSFKELQYFNFLASDDTKVFGHTYLFAILLLIGLALFYAQGVLFSYHYFL